MATGASTLDSLALAKWDREHQGPWEAEYSYIEEADLHRHYGSCKKNPGHGNFIPVDKFKTEDLPEGYRNQDVVDYIRGISYLTVRVTVKYVSDSRQENIPDSHKPYTVYNVRGQKRFTYGTGHVIHVDINQHSKGDHCKCKECQNSSTPVKDFATLTIQTATHVVFDEIEGQHTACHLFFDRGDTLDKCQGVAILAGMSDVSSDINEDICTMKHYTHNLELAYALCGKLKETEKICKALKAKMRNYFHFNDTPVAPERQPLLLIVSHPHGCSKQVSLGRWTTLDVVCTYKVYIMYDTATCPGSSGATVFLLSEPFDEHWVGSFTPIFIRGVHCGASKLLPETNFCNIYEGHRNVGGTSFEVPYWRRNDDSVESWFCAWQDTFCLVEAEDQGKHYAACKLNPGHKNCFPLHAFSMDNLPEFYRTKNVMNFVQLTSALTVRVSVNYVSDERPATYPRTNTPYPWPSVKGSNQTRVGNGWVQKAGIFDDACRCQECKNSPKPEPVGAYIYIFTAAHLVHNKEETEQTTCHLFYDSGETPGACKDVAALVDMHFINKNIAYDASILVCYTHNKDLVRKLSEMSSQYSHELYYLCRNYDFISTNYVNQNGGQNAKQETPHLQIIVSHPHGCSKHVSIRYANTYESLFPQPAMYCPGSSGAPVRTLGRKLSYPYVV